MPVVRLDPQYDNIRVRRYWALRVPISRPIPLTIFTVNATDTTDEPQHGNRCRNSSLAHTTPSIGSRGRPPIERPTILSK